jgi:hypothetical protein
MMEDVLLQDSNDQATPAPTPILAYASMATLALADTPTPTLLTALEATISTECNCNATVAAITHDNTTAFCSPATPCVLARRRRLLAVETTNLFYIDITLVSRAQLAHPPAQPTLPHIANWQT